MKERSPRALIFFTIFIDLLGFGIVIPIAAYIADDYTQGPWKEAQIGLLMASYSVCQMIFAPIWGRLSDRIGRRPVLFVSLFGSVVSYTLFGLATQYWMLLVARMFAGVCAANITVAQAYIADVTSPEKRSASMGLIGMAFGLGFALGPVFGGGLDGIRRLFWPGLTEQMLPGLGAAAICLVNLIWAVRTLPESLPPEKRGQTEGYRRLASVSAVMASLRHRTIGPLVGVFFLSTLAFANMEVMLGIYAKETPELLMKVAGIYGLFVYIGLLLAFMHGYVSRKLLIFIPETVLVIVGTFAQAVALLIFPLYPSLIWIFFSMAILAFGQGISVPSLLALVSKSVSASEQGHIMGITQSASSAARVVGPLFAVAVWHFSDSMSWPFHAGGIIMFGAVAMAVITRRRLLQAPGDFSLGSQESK